MAVHGDLGFHGVFLQLPTLSQHRHVPRQLSAQQHERATAFGSRNIAKMVPRQRGCRDEPLGNFSGCKSQTSAKSAKFISIASDAHAQHGELTWDQTQLSEGKNHQGCLSLLTPKQFWEAISQMLTPTDTPRPACAISRARSPHHLSALLVVTGRQV